jgi:NAD-dependent dihydropyrimidine dehydrogenase PreA subunit
MEALQFLYDSTCIVYQNASTLSACLDARAGDILSSGADKREGHQQMIPTLVYKEACMAYVITQPCIGLKDASCVDVCPVDCIHAGEEDEQYFINPEECIDCGACEPVCPVNAIFEEGSVPKKWKPFIQLNADYFLRQRQAKKKRK